MEKIKYLIIFFVLLIFFLSKSYSQTIHKAVSVQIESKTINPKDKIIAKVLDLPIPNMIYPSNGATNIPIIPVFSFSTVNGGDRYDIELSFDPYFSQIISHSYIRFATPTSANDTLSFAPGIISADNFTGGTIYYWRVQASRYDGSNSSPWSQPFTYTTMSGGSSLPQPNLIIPDYGSTITWIDVPLVWSIVNGATNYQVQYSTDSNFNGFTYWYTYGTQSSINTSIKPYKTYYWRVIGINENSLSQFSTANLFYTGSHATLSKNQDTFDDGSGLDNYDNNLDLYWLIHPNDAKQIVLSFSSFDTEQNYDFVTIYDGPTDQYPVLGKFSGNSIPDSVISSSNNLLVNFNTDVALNYSGWSANYYSLLGNKLYPTLTISSGSVSAGDVINVSSQNMSPNGVVNFTLTGPDTTITSSILADGQGNASTSFTISQDAIEGTYKINSTDVSSGRGAPSKYFYVTRNQTGPNMSWVFQIDDTISSGSDFPIQWKDQMIKNNQYQVIGSTRQYSYNIDLSSDGGSSWKILKTIEGSGRIYDWINISTVLNIQNTGDYKIRIVDNNVTSRTLTSNEFHVISQVTPYVNIGLAWDYSYTQSSNTPPIGVAADGVSRIYLTLSSTKSISQIQVSLSDEDGNTDAEVIGKVMNAGVTNQFSEEANNASQTTTTIISSNHDSQYWFWYVAPNDFVGNNPSNKYVNERIVSANFQISFSDGSTGLTKMPIKIVRPPLLLIHGLGGNGMSWNNFGYESQGFKKLFLEDNRFLVKEAPTIINNAGFSLGKIYVKNRIVQIIKKMRNLGFASNQVLYVGHSMGGNYLRTLVESNLYLSTQNYNQGYINKAIFLDSPNNGSPLADLLDIIPDKVNTISVTRFLLESYYFLHPDMFIQGFTSSIFKASSSWPYIGLLSVSDAVGDLRTANNGGYKFGQSNIPTHLIAGDYFANAQDLESVPTYVWDNIAKANDYFEFIDRISDILVVIFPPVGATTKGIIDPVEKALSILNYSLQIYSGVSFLLDSDLIVSVESQIAGLSRNTTNVTVLNNLVHAGNSNNSVTSNINAGNAVSDLVNIDNDNPMFDVIPANGQTSKINIAQTQSHNSQILFGIKEKNIEITSITDTSDAFVDSTITISFNIQDTVGLQYIKLFFQNKSYLSYDKSFNQGFTIQVSGNYLNAQPLEILAVYYNNDSTYWSYNTSTVNVKTNSSLQKFFIEPKVIEIASNQFYSPNYNAIYSSFLTKVQPNNSDLSFAITDPNIVSLIPGSNLIKGIANGETSLIISYKGQSDTLYIVVTDSLIATDIKVKDNYLRIPINFSLSQNYPNPFNPTTFIEFSIPRSELVKLKVYDILGREIKTLVNEIKQAGNYRIEFNAGKLASGVYFYRMQAGSFIETKKLILLK